MERHVITGSVTIFKMFKQGFPHRYWYTVKLSKSYSIVFHINKSMRFPVEHPVYKKFVCKLTIILWFSFRKIEYCIWFLETTLINKFDTNKVIFMHADRHNLYVMKSFSLFQLSMKGNQRTSLYRYNMATRRNTVNAFLLGTSYE